MQYQTRIRVYYEDSDAGGVVYYANYLKFAERARTEMLRSFGINQSQLRHQNGVIFVVRRAELDLIKPAYFDDLLTVSVDIKAISGASMDMEQVIERNDDNRNDSGSNIGETSIIAGINVKIACVNADTLTPTRIPQKVREILDAD